MRSGSAKPSYQEEPARAVRRHHIVVALIGVLRHGRADADGGRRVARRRDAGVTHLAGVGVLAVVAGRGDDDESGGRRFLHGLHQRILAGRREDVMAERQVDNLNVQPVLVGRDEFERRNHVARLARSLAVENLQTNKADVRRDALVLEIRLDAAAADEPGDVRAMAEVVVGAGRSATAVDVVVKTR